MPFSLAGRAAPRLYLFGLIVGGLGLIALLFFEIGIRTGLKFSGGPLPAWIELLTVGVTASVGLIGAALAQGEQRRADGWKDYSGPAPLLVAGALLAVITTISLMIEYGFKQMGLDVEGAFATLIVVLAYLATYAGLVHLLVVRTGALTWRDIVKPQRLAPSRDDWTKTPPAPVPVDYWGHPHPTWRARIAGGPIGDVLWAAVMLLPLLFVSNIASQLLFVILGLQSTDISSPVPTSVSDLDRWLTILAVAVIVPLGEEIFFRGFATNAWGRSIDRNQALVRGALLFAAIHIINVTSTDAGISFRAAIFNMGARVPVAIALTWLYMRRRSLLATGTLHGFYNGLIVILSILATE